jgi:serine/threonine protein kinase
MEYCEGNTLKTFIDENKGRKSEGLKWKIFVEVIEALNYLHN